MVSTQLSALNGDVGKKQKIKTTEPFGLFGSGNHVHSELVNFYDELRVQDQIEKPKGFLHDDPFILQLISSQVERASSDESQDSLEFVNEIVCEDKVQEGRKQYYQDDFDDFDGVKLNEQINNLSINRNTVGVEDFEILKVVGRGAFGKVYQVRMKGTSEVYAMKVMKKDWIIKKNNVGYALSERDILTKVDHPFIVKLRYSFQTKYRLYLVEDFINGGQLFFHLERHGLFREDLVRLYAAEIVSAVSYLHNHGFMHRDLKPENILLDAEGHVLLTDFGLAKEIGERGRAGSLCGTANYMSPEIVMGKSYDKSTDWWSVGILLYEMLTGKPPFSGGNTYKIQQRIIKEKIKLPGFLTSEAHSLLKGLLQKEVSRRLGNGPHGGEDIKRHKWFKSINWKTLEAREISPSFVPNVSGKYCVANFDERWTNMSVFDSPPVSPKSNDILFGEFTFIKSTR